MTFAETAVELDKALKTVDSKKLVLDKASEAVNKASEDYQNALKSAQDLRASLETHLASIPFPSNTGRVRAA